MFPGNSVGRFTKKYPNKSNDKIAAVELEVVVQEEVDHQGVAGQEEVHLEDMGVVDQDPVGVDREEVALILREVDQHLMEVALTEEHQVDMVLAVSDLGEVDQDPREVHQGEAALVEVHQVDMVLAVPDLEEVDQDPTEAHQGEAALAEVHQVDMVPAVPDLEEVDQDPTVVHQGVVDLVEVRQVDMEIEAQYPMEVDQEALDLAAVHRADMVVVVLDLVEADPVSGQNL